MMDESEDPSAPSPFEESSKQYLESAIFTDGADLEVIGEWLGTCRSILDVGAGTLHTAGSLKSPETDRVVGVDPSLAMLRDGLSRYESIPAVAGRTEQLPFASSAFEGIVCRYAAHHFSGLESFFEEVTRVLDPEGVFVIQDLVVPGTGPLGERINQIARLRDSSHEQYYSKGEWRRALESAGWSVRDTEEFGLPLTYTDWLDRADPSESSREAITSLFAGMSDGERRRINLSESNGRPDAFEYPVAMFCCGV